MFDIGGWEFLVIVVVGLIVIGPRDLPVVVKTIGGWMAKARELAREFRGGLDDLAREVELDRLRGEMQSSLASGEIGESIGAIRSEIEGTGREIEQTVTPGLRTPDDYEEAYSYYDETDDRSDEEEEAAERRRSHAPSDDAAPREEGDEAAPAPPAAQIKTGA